MKPTISQLHQAFPEKRDTEKYECDEICERGECIGYNQAIEDYEAYIKSKDHAEDMRGRYEIDVEKVFKILMEFCDSDDCEAIMYSEMQAKAISESLDDLIIVKEK